jgi:chemosensory pili system protein ChpC
MSERIAEIYSLLIPLADSRLLVPRACVAEVIGYQTPAPMDGAPAWYLGLVNWNARSLPLISFECACGQPGYFGIVSQGFPQLVRVSNDVVRPDHSRSFSDRAPVLCQIRMLNETPLIPDLERLELMIAEETSVMPERDAG